MNTDYLLHIKKLVIGFWSLSWYKHRSEQLLRPFDKCSVLLASWRVGGRWQAGVPALTRWALECGNYLLYIPRMSLSPFNHSGPSITQFLILQGTVKHSFMKHISLEVKKSEKSNLFLVYLLLFFRQIAESNELFKWCLLIRIPTEVVKCSKSEKTASRKATKSEVCHPSFYAIFASDFCLCVMANGKSNNTAFSVLLN